MTPPPTPLDPFAPPSPEVPWIVSDIFPSGQVHLIGGSRGAGKTAFECWLASHVLQGKPFLGHETHPPPFWGAIILDRSSEDRRHWWKAAGVEPLPYYAITESDMTPAALLKKNPYDCFTDLERWIDRIGAVPGGVVTIDVANFFAGDSRLGYVNAFARGWGLAKIAHDRQLTILALMHGGKQFTGTEHRYARLTDRIIASTGFLGVCGTIAYLTTRQESQTPGAQEFEWEPHHAPSESFKFKRTSDGLYAPYAPADRIHVKPKEQVTRLDYLDFIPLADSGDYITTADLIAKLKDLWGFHENAIKKNLAKLAAEGYIFNPNGTPGRWQKRNPDTHYS